ncbi:hypothetical protein RRG08_034122 [Elysia crispata]|uniref:Uncharacterized protein n=1 Tax=Elysia crispata TaxID=231223 RepID=A0AAE1DHP2_9GAST|nr:hypothetical protein RRG08_034122 [Elysia crispata]
MRQIVRKTFHRKFPGSPSFALQWPQVFFVHCDCYKNWKGFLKKMDIKHEYIYLLVAALLIKHGKKECRIV